MAIDGLNQLSNEQLLALNMMGNGQITNDSDSSSNGEANDEMNLAFGLVMKNLLETSKNSKQNNDTTVSVNKSIDKNQSIDAKDLDNDKTNSEDLGIKNKSNVVMAGQQYATGQNLEDIPMILNNNYINFTKDSGSVLSSSSNPDINKIYNAANTAAKKYGVDSNLILAIIKQESDFDPNSTSGSGAAGLMQIMPQNFSSLGITDQYDIDQNIDGGTKLLKEYLDQYNGNTEMALMAYNGGPGTMQRRGVTSSDDLYKMPTETQNYVPKVMGYYRSGV
jgi:soluble lytic murein transglycosylase-like protein